MWKCTGKLGRADDLHLNEVEYPQQEYTNLIQCLKECLEDFLDWDIRGICIAVICGVEGPSHDNDQLSLLDAPMRIARYVSQGQYIEGDGQVTTTLTNDYVCIAIRHEGGDDVDAMLGNLYAGISKVLQDISKDTEPIDGNESKVKDAKASIKTAIGLIMAIPASIPNIKVPYFAETTGTNLDDVNIKDHFPRVKILAFMPLNAYEIFEVPENLFFKQIHSIIRIEDPARVIMTRAEYDSMIAAAEAKAEELQAQFDAAQQMSVAEIEELKAQLAAAKAEVEELKKLVKELQSKLAQKVVGPSLLENSDLRTDATNETVANVEIMQEGRVWVDPNFEQPHLLDGKPPIDKQNSQDSPNKRENLNKQEHQMKENLSGPDVNKDDSHNPINDDKSNVEHERDHDYDEGRGRD